MKKNCVLLGLILLSGGFVMACCDCYDCCNCYGCLPQYIYNKRIPLRHGGHYTTRSVTVNVGARPNSRIVVTTRPPHMPHMHHHSYITPVSMHHHSNGVGISVHASI